MRAAQPSDPALQHVPCPRGFMGYTDEGHGVPVVAFHGCPGSVNDWRWVGGGLNGRLRLIRFDLPGFGSTPLETFPDAGFAARGGFLAEVLTDLGVDEFVAMGHSAGAPLALELGVLCPQRVRAVVLVAGPGLRPHGVLRKNPMAKRIAAAFKVPGMRRLLIPQLRAGFERSGFPKNLPDEAIVQSMAIIRQLDFRRQKVNFEALSRPLVLAWADNDNFIEPAINEEVAALGHRGMNLRCPGGGHYLQKTYSQEIADTLVNLLQDGAI